MAANALPETLRSVTATKIEELSYQRNLFEEQKATLFLKVSQRPDLLSKTRCLLEGTCQMQNVRLPSETISDDQDEDHRSSGPVADALLNKHFLLRQAAVDPAVSNSVISDIFSQLEKDFHIKSTQHMHAKFFSELVTEWLAEPSDQREISQDQPLGGSFEEVGRKEMHEQRNSWENIVFSTSKIDDHELKAYLQDLFHSTKQTQKAHKNMVKATRSFCAKLTEQKDVFTPDMLHTYIKGLLSTDLLSDQNTATLRTFTSNKEVLKEVSDVLNMRWRSLRNWQWSMSGGAIPVEMRKQLNGKYRVFMDEDVLDALLLYVIGLKFSVHFKYTFNNFVRQAFTKPGNNIPHRDRARREYYLGNDTEPPSGTVQTDRYQTYLRDYFMTQLPANEHVGKRDYDDGDEDAADWGSNNTQKNPMELKHGLLHLLVGDALIAQHLHPDAKHTVVRSDFKWFGPSIPHQTIYTVLEFLGVEDNWLDLFKRFLQTPLRFAQDGPNAQIRVRSRGVPMSHTLSDMFGEAILFAMDVSVNQATSSYLYRLHDDFWFWGPEQLCIEGWEAMARFAGVMGLEFNQEKTGTVTISKHDKPSKLLPQGDVKWGFLRLDGPTGNFVGDLDMVRNHVQELRLQLSYCNSIFSYIQCYNAYFARFFTNNFGKPSFGFGRGHIDMMVDTFAKIQGALFPEASVTSFLAELAESRFGVTDLPVGFWYWPVDLGGLDLQNPIIPLIAMRETMRQTPQKMLAKALDEDEAAYVVAKENFLRKNTGKGISSNPLLDVDIEREIKESQEEFMPREEYLRYRAERSAALHKVYQQLLQVPEQEQVTRTPELKSWLSSIWHDSPRHITGRIGDMKPYWKWVLALYGKEVMQKYASIQLVDQEKVPLGVVSLMKAGKVKWRG